RTVSALNIGAELRATRVDRSGISATRIEVLVNGISAEAVSNPTEHRHSHAHTQEHDHEYAHAHEHSHSHTVGETQTHNHAHGRSLSAIREIIGKADLPAPARKLAIRAFELLGEAEAGVHNVPIESIHFHEVGAVDAIVDIVCAAVGCVALQVDEFICSPLNVGGGTVKCAHGEFPVPAPATLALLKGAPVYSAGENAELVTPTGAAIIRALECRFASFPRMSVDSVGYGAGSRNPAARPNVLRLSIGEEVEKQRPVELDDQYQHVTILETTLDDLSPQVIGYVTERALAAGALDVFLVPVQMKKNRPGALLAVLCEEQNAQPLRELLFRETSTIGIRTRRERRDCLERTLLPVGTPWGTVRIKESRLNGTITNFNPEYEDCRKIAEAHRVPLKEVQQRAIASYLAQRQTNILPPGTDQSAPQPGSKSQVA
ncbi:MAG: nickel pincer cofactor biosynthesis protein LarC, partial [Acidobacteria bacterium]|nr:nickel pincer cofactor biosynthesis protein LarC [Acidobacteriota bacterium]